MAQLIWSPRALQDLTEIGEYIARDSNRFAQVMVERLIASASRIPEQPWAGSVVPEYNLTTLRERFVQSYRMIYRIRADVIELVTIYHGARMLPDEAP